MIQLALYMGFSEIYLYGWDGLFPLNIDDNGAAENSCGGRSRRLSRRRKGADGAGQEIRRKQRLQVCSACARPTDFPALRRVPFESVDLSTSAIFGRI